MPAAPGATPRKMFPPPMTTPSSTPRRATCAISATIASIVCRLMPKGSSPIRASPESLRRMRLYFGVTRARSVNGLARLLDSLADEDDGVVVDPGFLRAEHFLDGFLVVEDVGLAKQGDFGEVLVERAFHHLGGDLGRLAGVLGARLLDLPLALRVVGRNLRLREILRPVEGNVHGESLAHLLGPVEIDQHA